MFRLTACFENGRETGMEDQVEATLDMVVAYWAAGEEVWIPLIDIKIKNSDMESAGGLQSVLELFEKAEEDYLCTYTIMSLQASSTKQCLQQ